MYSREHFLKNQMRKKYEKPFPAKVGDGNTRQLKSAVESRAFSLGLACFSTKSGHCCRRFLIFWDIVACSWLTVHIG